MLRFSVFELDSSVPELRHRGRRVHLQEVPLRALQILLEHPNELVPRDVFFTRLWPDDVSGILDDNLNTAVRKLRLALNDSAHHPRFIETVPKRGYRFVAPVSRDEETAAVAVRADPAAADAAPLPAERRAPWSVFPRAGAVAVIAAAVVAIVASIALFQPGDRAPEEPATAAARGEFSTLAVLPFVNASGNPEDEYFSDGLAVELMDRLS
ncbi:MAG: winged helix-turn-helix domain-containing protein, partial [Woeseiaceae bacterium]